MTIDLSLDTVPHWIAGAAVSSTAGPRTEIHDPATGRVIGTVALGGADVVDEAVASARTAAVAWADTPSPVRASVLHRFRVLLHEQMDDLAWIITAEQGKTLDDARGELARSIEAVDVSLSVVQQLKGEYAEQVANGVDTYSFRQPLGVCAGITPFNFPVMVPVSMFAAAIACGNTFVLKPSEQVPSAAVRLAQIASDAGLPDGVLNIVHGGIEAAEALIDHPDVAAVSFVGSTPVARAIYRRAAEAVIRKYQDVADAEEALEATRRWWRDLIGTVRVESESPEFDAYLDWLKYQALAERIWSRRGFYQASGAYGFRDQLQDSVSLLWADPEIARRQILLHASQQFLEGDVVHWFHRLQDGRTGFVGRSHASDNLLWLAWAVVEYVGATGDESLLDERTPYLESEQPFEPLPRGKHGMGFDPIRSTRSDTVYDHCRRAIDLVLDKRMGAHGLPLIGTGDWNDGLDEIGSEGRGESVWLGLFLSYILRRFIPIAEARDGHDEDYVERLAALDDAIQKTWRGDRYLRAIHDDGTEIGVKGSGVWEIDALTAAWAVMAGIDPERGRIAFETALAELEQETTIKLGTPPLREDTHPYLGRSSWYPEGVRENGMYCHGVQWLVGAARVLSDRARERGDAEWARRYAETAFRLWKKIAAVYHAVPGEIEIYGGQPNKQAADMVTTFDPGRMIWNGYTGAAGWMFRQALESVLGLKLAAGRAEVEPVVVAEELGGVKVARDVSGSPFAAKAETSA